MFGYSLDKILISKLDDDGAFYSIIYYSNQNHKVEADARTADAIALALRHNSPIFINKMVLSKA